MARPPKWNSPTASVRLPAHLIPRLVEIAESLDQELPEHEPDPEFEAYCDFVQNSAQPKLVTIRDSEEGFHEHHYLLQVDQPLSMEEWRSVKRLVSDVEQKYLAGLDNQDRLYLLSRMIQKVFPEIDLNGRRIQGGGANANG